MIGKAVTGREYANEYGARDYAQTCPPYYVKAALTPEGYARAYEFPDLEDAMPRARRPLFTPWAFISPWGWGLIATVLTAGLIMLIALGGTV